MIKIAIVGPDASKWTLDERRRAYGEILKIFIRHIEIEVSKARGSSIRLSYPGGFYGLDGSKYITLVSGGCRKGGVDLWAECVAVLNGIEMDIKEPIVDQWDDRNGMKGYKSRNMDIARDCDILYLVNPSKNLWSGGMWTFQRAQELGKEVYEVVV